jgi:hypothetical protein
MTAKAEEWAAADEEIMAAAGSGRWCRWYRQAQAEEENSSGGVAASANMKKKSEKKIMKNEASTFTAQRTCLYLRTAALIFTARGALSSTAATRSDGDGRKISAGIIEEWRHHGDIRQSKEIDQAK